MPQNVDFHRLTPALERSPWRHLVHLRNKVEKYSLEIQKGKYSLEIRKGNTAHPHSPWRHLVHLCRLTLFPTFALLCFFIRFCIFYNCFLFCLLQSATFILATNAPLLAHFCHPRKVFFLSPQKSGAFDIRGLQYTQYPCGVRFGMNMWYLYLIASASITPAVINNHGMVFISAFK